MVNSNRADFSAINKEAFLPLYRMGAYLKKSTIEERLQLMVMVRASQINGCANCLDMHWKDAKALGETEQRLYGLSVWRDYPFYTDREKAAFLWTEAVTACKVPNEVYQEVSKYFATQELVDLTFCINAINAWNRLNIAFPKKIIGDYAPGQYVDVEKKQ